MKIWNFHTQIYLNFQFILNKNLAPKNLIHIFKIIKIKNLMEINNFIKNFINTFDETPTNVEIDENVDFRNLDGWDSLTALGIIAMVDDEYGVGLTGEDIRKSNTIGDIFKIVKSKKD